MVRYTDELKLETTSPKLIDEWARITGFENMISFYREAMMSDPEHTEADTEEFEASLLELQPDHDKMLEMHEQTIGYLKVMNMFADSVNTVKRERKKASTFNTHAQVLLDALASMEK